MLRNADDHPLEDLLANETPPIAEHDEAPINFLLASGHTHKDTILSLCRDLKLNDEERAAAQHLLPTDNSDLAPELLPLIERHRSDLIHLIGEQINRDHASPELSLFIEKEKKKLLESMLSLKSEKIHRLMREQTRQYEQHLSAALPTKYIHLEHTYYYIKKNIIVEVYNAGRDYYKEIWQAHHNDANNFPAKIKSFNEKFAGIVQIDPLTLKLSPIEIAFKNMEPLSLTHDDARFSFEKTINALVSRCAHDSMMIIGRQYGVAFQCVQHRLNAFNMRDYNDPLENDRINKNFFVPLAAPLEGSRLSLLKYIPGAAKTAEITSGLKSMVAGKGAEFAFNLGTKNLLEQLEPQKEVFHRQVLKVRQFIDSVKATATRQIECDEPQLDYACAKNNINAFADLLRQRDSIAERIQSLEQATNKHIAALAPTARMESKLGTLANHYGLDETEASELAGCVFNQTGIEALNQSTEALSQLQQQLKNQTLLLNEFIQTQSATNAPLCDSKGCYTHTTTIASMNTATVSANSALDKIKANTTHLDCYFVNASQLIGAFEQLNTATKRCNDFTKQQTTTLQILSNGHPNDAHILQLAIEFYDEADRNHIELQQAIKSQQQQFQDTIALLKENTDDKKGNLLEIYINELASTLAITADKTTKSFLQSISDNNHLLLCHIYVKTLLNFPHWSEVRELAEPNDTIEDGASTFRIPRRINDLVALLAKPDFTDWMNDASQAKKLLAAMQQAATRPSRNQSVEALLAHLRQPNNSKAPVQPELINQTMNQMRVICHKHNLGDPTLISTEQLIKVKRRPSFWEKHPVLKKTLIGAAIGASIVALGAIIITTLIVANVFAVAAISGIGAIIGLTGVAAVITAAGAAIGFKAGRSQEMKSTPARLSPKTDQRASSSATTLHSLSKHGSPISKQSYPLLPDDQERVMIDDGDTRLDFEYEFAYQLAAITQSADAPREKMIAVLKTSIREGALPESLNTFMKLRAGNGITLINQAIENTKAALPDFNYALLSNTALTPFLTTNGDENFNTSPRLI